MPDTPRRLAALYALGALLLLGQALWYYLVADYGRILLPALLAPLLLIAALMRLGQQETARLSAYLALVCGYLLIATSLPGEGALPTLWLGLPALLTLLLLPLGPATLLNLSLAPVWLLLADGALSPGLVVAYLALVGAGGLAPWGMRHHQALLAATDPRDDECPALKPLPLLERLESEVERAELLGQRLAVVVLHLPQLEMAGEQFGGAARRALLEALCATVAEQSRDHDRLGRPEPATFWLVLPGTGESGALLVRQRIEEAAASRRLAEIGDLEVRGATCLHTPGHTFSALRQRLEATGRRLADG